MVIVNSITASGVADFTDGKGLGNALSKIGAVKAEFNTIGAVMASDFTYSVEGIPGLPQGQAYQAGSNVPGKRVDHCGQPPGKAAPPAPGTPPHTPAASPPPAPAPAHHSCTPRPHRA